MPFNASPWDAQADYQIQLGFTFDRPTLATERPPGANPSQTFYTLQGVLLQKTSTGTWESMPYQPTTEPGSRSRLYRFLGGRSILTSILDLSENPAQTIVYAQVLHKTPDGAFTSPYLGPEDQSMAFQWIGETPATGTAVWELTGKTHPVWIDPEASLQVFRTPERDKTIVTVFTATVVARDAAGNLAYYYWDPEMEVGPEGGGIEG